MVTPGYSALLKQGVIINNPYEKFERTLVAEKAHLHGIDGGTFDFYVSRDDLLAIANASPPAIDNSLFDDRLRQQALIRCIANIEKTPYGFAEDVAEWRSTLKTLRAPISSMKEVSVLYKSELRRLSRIYGKSTSQALAFKQAAAQAWLKYRFEFSPLLRSIQDVFESVSENSKIKKQLSTRLRASSSYDEVVPINYTKVQTGSNSLVWRTSGSAIRKGRFSLIYETTNPLSGFRFNYGLRNKDIPVTIWAIMPYSFMVDRVTNISSAIKALTNLADPSVRILSASYSIRDTVSYSEYCLWTGIHAGATLQISTPYTRFDNWVFKKRSPIPIDLSSVVSNIAFRPEGLVSDVTSTLDLAALVLQNLKFGRR